MHEARGDLWALVDQGLISTTNFVLFVLVGRAADKAEFGAFTLTYTAFLLAYGVQAAVVTQAHNVLGTSRSTLDYRRYTGSTSLLQVAVAAAFIGLTLTAAAAVWALGAGSTSMLLAAAVAIGAWQAHEFFRRVCYTEGRLRSAVVIDVVGYGGQAVSVAALWGAGELTGTTAFVAMAGCSALAALYGASVVRESVAATAETSAWRENWLFGRWLFAAWLAFWISTQISVYLAAGFVGADAAGAIKAAQIVLAPLNVLLLSLSTVLPIRLAAVAHRDRAALSPAVRRAFVVTAPVVVAYLVIAALAARPALTLLYGDKYENEGSVVALFALFYAASYVATVLISVLTAIQQTRSVLAANAAGALTATVTGVLLTWALGISGAVLAMTAAELAILVVVAAAYRRFLG